MDIAALFLPDIFSFFFGVGPCLFMCLHSAQHCRHLILQMLSHQNKYYNEINKPKLLLVLTKM